MDERSYQLKPGPPPASIQSMLILSKVTRLYVGLKLEALKLDNGQDELLIALHSVGSTTVSQIADLIHVRPSTVSKSIDRLEAKGLVQRHRNENDGRVRVVRLTEDGHALALRIQALYMEIDRELDLDKAIGLKGDALHTIQTLLDRIYKKLRRIR